jgi:protein-S-isoprenylcysteine O-methyltransferase Ste14
MPPDDTFRLAVLIIVAVLAPIAVVYRVRSFTGETLDRWQEGPFLLFGLRLSGVPAFIGIVVWMVDSRRMAWSAISLPIEVRWAGIALAVLSGILLTWTFHCLGRNLTDTVVTRRNHSLVTTGPYRFVRHPFYLSFLLSMTGVSLAMANWFILLGGFLTFGFMVARLRQEEAQLLERFGDEYRDYMRRVGRFFPRFR